MPGKRARPADDADPTPNGTPKKLRFGELTSAKSSPAQRTPSKRALKNTKAGNGTPSKSALKGTTTSNGTHPKPVDTEPEAETPSKRASKRGPALTTSNRSSKKDNAFITPTRHAAKAAATPSTAARHADRSARKKATRNLVERAAAGDLSDDELGDALADRIYDGEESDSEVDADGVLPTTEAPSASDAGTATDPNTPSKRGRGRPKGSKNKRTPTPPPDIPPYERYFFQNRPSAWKHASNTPCALPLLAHTAYYDAIGKIADPHADSIAALHAHHAQSFPRWDFELQEGFTVVLHGYGSKRRLLTAFAEYLHRRAPNDTPQTTVIVHAHHPAFTLRSLLHAVAKAAGLRAADLPATVPALLAYIEAHLAAHLPNAKIYLLISTLTARALTTPQALSILVTLAGNPHLALLLTASNPSFPLLWPSTTRDALNPVLHDATTFLPYDSGTGPLPTAGTDPSLSAPEDVDLAPYTAIPPPPAGLSALGPSAPDAVAELLGRKPTTLATRARVRWVLRSLPANARGLYKLLLEEILAAAAADRAREGPLGPGPGGASEFDAMMAEGGFDPFEADPELNLSLHEGPMRRGRGRPRKDAGVPGEAAGAAGGAAGAAASETPLPAVSSKALYEKARGAFLCSSEMAFRGLLREFVDHAMVEVRPGLEGGEMLSVGSGMGMGRGEAEEVVGDLGTEL